MSEKQCKHGNFVDDPSPCNACEAEKRSELAPATGSPSDTELLDYLTQLLTHCPHAEILYNDDPDVELPVGFTIRVEGCMMVETTAPTLRECILKDMRKSESANNQ